LSRLKGLILILMLMAIGIALNQILFSSFASHSTHELHKHSPTNATISIPRCTVTSITLSNVTINNFFFGNYVLNPLTPFVKTFVVERPSLVIVNVSGENVSVIKVFVAVENRGSLTIESPQLYKEVGHIAVYEALIPPGMVSVVMLNTLEEPVHIQISIVLRNVG